MTAINSRIALVREVMNNAGLSAYIFPSSDAHNSEYVADHWLARTWISGFTGSAGTAVVTIDHAGLWTDSRYFLQAEMELARSDFELHKLKNQFRAEHAIWLAENLKEGSVVGVNPSVCTHTAAKTLKDIFSAKGIKLSFDHKLDDLCWQDRPALPSNKAFAHDIQFAGERMQNKLRRIQAEISRIGVDHHLVCTLDDIAWIFNIRGSDVTYNPVVIAYALISQNEVTLFIDNRKVDDDLNRHFSQAGIKVLSYDMIESTLAGLSKTEKILVDPSNTNEWLYNKINAEIVDGKTISRKMKAIKNPVEIKWIKEVMVKDGVALVKLYRWLEDKHAHGGVTEAEVSDQLAIFRSQQFGYQGESFGAIVGWRGNGAIIHYRPEHGQCAKIEGEGVLLIDSGGQYVDGTTDITRTTVFGDASDYQKKAYTMVLKGHIGLALAKFPKGTTGVQLDILARQHLWQNYLNYSHGTGHGVGFFLNVHESPQGFAPGFSERGTTAHEVGMLTSNEPGFYVENGFGIRIENLVITAESEQNQFGDFLRFETVTLFPIDTSMIDMKFMLHHEIAWLNSYHRKVYAKLSPHLNVEEQSWLEEKCRAGLALIYPMCSFEQNVKNIVLRFFINEF